MKKNRLPVILLLPIIVAIVSLLRAITDKIGFIKYVYILILVCILVSSILIFMAWVKSDKKESKH